MRTHPVPTLVLLFAAYLLLRRPGIWRWAAWLLIRLLLRRKVR